MTKLPSETIGRLGERKFDDLCELAGLTVSALIPDLTGKDRHIEFPLIEPTGTLTYDTRPAPLACYVQVKTLLAKNERFDLRLSAAERLARDPKPAFIAVLRIDEVNQFVDMHLIHLDGEILAAILKRLRKEQAKGSKRINNKIISLSISSGRKVDVDPSALREVLSTAIGQDMLAYATRKHQQIKELGFDAARFNLKIAFGPAKIEQFVDGFLGLSDLPVKKFEAFERRFGIALPTSPRPPEAREPEYHVLRLQPHPLDRCTVTATKIGDSKGTELEGDVFFSVIPGIDPKFFKALIKTELADFIISDSSFEIEFGTARLANKEHSLESLRRTYELLDNVSKPECSLTFRFHKSGREISPSPCSFNSGGDIEWIGPLSKLISAADDLKQLAKIPDYPVSVESLIANQSKIFEVHAVFTGNSGAASVRFTTDAKLVNLPSEKTSLLLISGVNIGKRAIVYALRVTATPHHKGASIDWTSEKVEPLAIRQLSGNLHEEYSGFRDEMTRISGLSMVLQSTLTSTKE